MIKALIEKFKKKILYSVLSLFQPEIIGYTQDFQGNRIYETRVSNVSHLSFKENIKLGANVFIGHFNYIDGRNKLTIGAGCQITNYVSILTHSSHNSIRLYGEKYPLYWRSNMKGLVQGPVVIGEYSFIGPHSVIMPGTVLGKGCIVSAYSFVEGSFEDFSIIRGSPAKVVGDTRKVDEGFLNEFPELREMYYLGNE